MNWDMLGALGEILGGLAVVATLVYLSRQIRAGLHASRRAAAQEVLDQTGHFLDGAARTPESAEAWVLGLAGDASLSEGQRHQFRILAYRWTLLMERLYQMAQSGDLDAWLGPSAARVRRDIVAGPGYQEWFRSRGHWLTPDFRALVANEIASSGAMLPELQGEAEGSANSTIATADGTKQDESPPAV